MDYIIREKYISKIKPFISKAAWYFIKVIKFL